MSCSHSDTLLFVYESTSILFLLFNIIFGLYSIIKSTQKCQCKKVLHNKLFIALYTIFMCSGTVIVLTTIVFCQSSFNEWILTIIYLTGFTLHYIGLPLLCLLYLLYFKKTCVATQYAISPSVFRSFVCLFIVQIFSAISMECFLLPNQRNIKLTAHITFVCINAISNISLLYIFGHKIRIVAHYYRQEINLMTISDTTEINTELTALTISLSPTKTESKDVSVVKSISTSKSKPRVRKRSNKKGILTKIIRITVCALISFISSNLMNALSVYIMSTMTIINIHSVIIIINQTTIMISLFLTHKYSKSVYIKGCKKIHFFVYHLFVPKHVHAGNIQTESKNDKDTGVYGYSTTDNDTTATPNDLPVLQKDHVTDLDVSTTY
eukprot:260632_1